MPDAQRTPHAWTDSELHRQIERLSEQLRRRDDALTEIAQVVSRPWPTPSDTLIYRLATGAVTR